MVLFRKSYSGDRGLGNVGLGSGRSLWGLALPAELLPFRLRTVSNVTPRFCTVLTQGLPAKVHVRFRGDANCVKGMRVLRQNFGDERAHIANQTAWATSLFRALDVLLVPIVVFERSPTKRVF